MQSFPAIIYVVQYIYYAEYGPMDRIVPDGRMDTREWLHS